MRVEPLVNIVSFTVETTMGSNTLQWEIADAFDGSFTVQVSPDTTHWENLGDLIPDWSWSNPNYLAFSFEHVEPKGSKIYYRLLISQKFVPVRYSQIVGVINEYVLGIEKVKQPFVVFPNPASTSAQIIPTNPSSTARKIILYNAAGQPVYESKLSGKPINVQNLPRGAYHILIEYNNGNRQSGKILVE